MDTTTHTVFSPSTADSEPAHSPTSHGRRRTRRRVLVLLALLIVAVLVATLGRDGSESSVTGRQAATGAGSPEPHETGGTPGGETASAAFETGSSDGDGAGSGAGDGGGTPALPELAGDGPPAPVELDPGGDDTDPCEGHSPEHGDLLVGPDPLVVASGTLHDVVFVRNCGDATVDWTAKTVPGVDLGDSAGSLPAGQLTEVPFAIDSDDWEPGAVEFKIKVSEPGHNHYVDVHAFRPTFGKDMQAATGFSAGEGVGGCSDGCITKALLESFHNSPNVGLDVETKVPAKLRVYVSTNAPAVDQDGDPVFPGVSPIAASPQGVTQWSTVLKPLQAATKYHIIVSATDDDGDEDRRAGSFTTVTPVEGPGAFDTSGPEPGCASKCVTKATITPGDGLAPSSLSVQSHTPARYQVQLSTVAPVDQGGVPTFAQTDLWLNSGLEYHESWDVQLSDLDPGTKYFVVLSATDANGNTDHRTGAFTTDSVDVTLMLHTIHVTQDGDKAKVNAGELTFSWAAGDTFGAISAEHKIKAGGSFTFDVHDATLVVEDAAGFLPTVRVEVADRDWDGKAELCSMGNAPAHEPGSNDDCDSRWNVALNGLVHVTSFDGMQRCDQLGLVGNGWDAVPCQRIQSHDLGDEYPEFWTVLSYHVH